MLAVEGYAGWSAARRFVCSENLHLNRPEDAFCQQFAQQKGKKMGELSLGAHVKECRGAALGLKQKGAALHCWAPPCGEAHFGLVIIFLIQDSSATTVRSSHLMNFSSLRAQTFFLGRLLWEPFGQVRSTVHHNSKN